jgi:hypothetical protein
MFQNDGHTGSKKCRHEEHTELCTNAHVPVPVRAVKPSEAPMTSHRRDIVPILTWQAFLIKISCSKSYFLNGLLPKRE